MNEKECWIWLQRALGQGSNKPAQLLEAFGSIGSIYEAGRADYLKTGFLTGREITRLCDKSLEKASQTTADCLRLGYSILTYTDDDYPERLRSIYAPPCLLYIQGELRDVDSSLLLAVVGTRQVTEYGTEVATRLAMGLGACGVEIVSGLALGVDTFAHKGALKGSGRTIAVIGCGLDIDYPASNRELRRLIVSNGAIVSEYPPGAQPLSFNFPVRNRIIAGLSLGTIVIEAGARSGSLITAGLAAEMGREVFAVPGNITSPMSEGTNRLLRDGAKPALNVSDILEEYLSVFPESINIKQAKEPVAGDPVPGPEPKQLSLEKGGPKIARKVPQNLTGPQTEVYKVLSEKPVHVDQIALLANLETRIVLGALTTLEIQGLVKSFPGRMFSAI